MIEEREAKIVNFSCVGVLTLTHFLSPFLPRLRRRQGLGCVSQVRVRVMVELFWLWLRVKWGLE